MKQKRFYVLISALIVVLLISGCATSSNPKNTGAEGQNGALTNDSAAGKTITLAYSQGAGQTMDPHAAGDLTSASYAFALYDQLVTSGTEEVDGKTMGRTDQIVPSLAESWKISDDLTTYTFTMRAGANFQSGSPVNADAVVYSFERAQTKSESGSSYKLANIQSVTKIDDATVEFKLNAPNHLFLKYLATFSFSIVDPTVAKSNPDDYLTQHSAGSGAYKLEKWDPATEAVFVANKDYWNGAPKVEKVVIKYVAEASNRELFLEKGEVDVAFDIPAKDVESLKKKDNVTINSESSNRIVYLGMNAAIKPFDQLEVRQAINYVIDQKKLVKDVAYGQAAPLRSSISSKSPNYSAEGNVYEYDLEKAKALLKEAGYENGFTFDLTVNSSTQDYEDIAVLLKSELEKVGVTLNINKVAPAQYRELTSKKAVPAYLGKYTSLVNDPSYHYGFLLDSNGASNYTGYSSKIVDDLLAQANEEPDDVKRAELYNQVQQQVTADSPWAYLYESNLIVGISKDVKGYTFYPDEIARFSSLYK